MNTGAVFVVTTCSWEGVLLPKTGQSNLLTLATVMALLFAFFRSRHRDPVGLSTLSGSSQLRLSFHTGRHEVLFSRRQRASLYGLGLYQSRLQNLLLHATP